MTDRNSPCPCMSGLKYKKCCLKREFILKHIPCQTYIESYALQNLLASSPEFKSFYNTERSKIRRNIIWAHDPELNSNVRATYLFKPKEHLLAFSTLPIPPDDGFDTAHELQHFICSEEGYPSVGISDILMQTSTNLASALSSALNDPIANKRLVPFGFDLWAQYDQASTNEKKYFESTDEPQAPTEKLYSTAFYISKTLNWDVSCLFSPRKKNDFLEWYDAKFPNFSKEAKESLALVRKIGYETPEEATAVFTELIARFELDKSLKIITYPFDE
ncbi:MAG: SEC-C domain-containing protein [Desulfitobacteriaceae bacterium]|nr:SEC-C domain-containing protein [Desulfitobacteriaceae bacterium]MDD4345455.1 SEC-C domain-containing protein [Desulfitobacteriaceae bacterium]MDD4400698.1 SEC-C domain-containing protein [Desulfitobacteriaceae bacterium]